MGVTQIVPTARSGDSSKIVTAREAVRLIRSRDTVAISGFGGIGFAEAIIHELADFYQSKDTEPGTLRLCGRIFDRLRFCDSAAESGMIYRTPTESEAGANVDKDG